MHSKSVGQSTKSIIDTKNREKNMVPCIAASSSLLCRVFLLLHSHVFGKTTFPATNRRSRQYMYIYVCIPYLPICLFVYLLAWLSVTHRHMHTRLHVHIHIRKRTHQHSAETHSSAAQARRHEERNEECKARMSKKRAIVS